MQTRMEATENKYVFMTADVLNCEGWERKNEDGEEDLDNVAELFNHFRKPLLKAGLDGSVVELLQQWHDLVTYTKALPGSFQNTLPTCLKTDLWFKPGG